MAVEQPIMSWPARLGFDRIDFVDVQCRDGRVRYEVHGRRHRRSCAIAVPGDLGRRLLAEGVPRLLRKTA